MDMSQEITPKKPGQQLVVAEQQILLAKMLEKLSEGYMSTYALSKQLKVNRKTIDKYRPLVDKIIKEQTLDRNVIRNLQIQRTYKIIEMLMKDLTGAKDTKSRALIYNSIFKFSSHLALITGLNVETHVNVDPTKLVIIRSAKRKEIEVTEDIPGAGKEIVSP